MKNVTQQSIDPALPPELENLAANAFNALEGSCLGSPIFTLSYNKGHTVNWGDMGARSIPDQLSASAAPSSHKESRTILLEVEADYDRTYSASIDASYSGVAWSGSLKSSFLYHGNLFTSTSSSYALDCYIQSVLKFKRLNFTKSDLDADFVSAICNLPLDTVGDNKQKYFDFFNSYGTHYLQEAEMGGTIVMETDINDDVFNTSTELEVSAAISVGYEGVVSSGKLDAEAAYKASDFLKKHENNISISLSVMGGLFSPDGTITAWQNSIYNNGPILLLNSPTTTTSFTQLVCISRLATIAGAQEGISSNIESMLVQYMNTSSEKDGLIGRTKTNRFSDVIEATNGDGFFVGTITKKDNGDRGWLVSSNDTSENPTTNRVFASQHYYTDSDKQIPSASFLLPAKNGNTSVSNANPTSGYPTTVLNYIALGDIDEAMLQDWLPVDLGSEHIASTDGFVVSYVDWNDSNGARGYVIGAQYSSTLNKWVNIAGASQHKYSGSDIHVPNNSFTMPVRKDTKYKVLFTATSPNPVAKAFFVPISSTISFFKDYETRTANNNFHAKTDGFLVAYLAMKNNGDRGYVDLFSYPNEANLLKNGKLSSTSIHYYTGSDVQVPYNTATIPVAKNNYYTAQVTNTSGAPDLSLLWFPIVRT